MDALRHVCDTATLTLAASGAGLSVMARDGVHGMATASDAATERVEELQFTIGEGPCVDAFATRRPVLISDLGLDAMRRWPLYGPAVHDAGVRAVFSFPMQIGAARLGVLDVFRARAGALTARELTRALTLADLAVGLLLDGQEGAAPGLPAGDLSAGVERRAELFQAQGMVMVQIDGTLADAMTRIRAHAYAEDRRLGEVAADVVAHRLRFGRDHP